ncbi:hypothetical protein [Streptomyces sirii]|uniref:hypothetical protein n=1 Tax=Streptomyces sirii TaxID=3127701 RepID=UPI003D35AA46
MVKKLKDKNAPKRPPSAFAIFSIEARQKDEVSRLPVLEQAPAIGQMWKQLTEEERHAYEEKSAEIRAQHERETAE